VELGRRRRRAWPARAWWGHCRPSSWAAATPAIRLAATVLQGTSPAVVPLVATDSGEPVCSQMALASLAGSALAGTVSRAVTRTGARKEGSSSGNDKDSSGNGKYSKTSDKLKRVLAELSQKPGSVQHWHTDKTHLEGLLSSCRRNRASMRCMFRRATSRTPRHLKQR
jgi:hypothetical protein